MLETFTQLHTHRLCVPKKRGPDNLSEKRVPCVSLCVLCVSLAVSTSQKKNMEGGESPVYAVSNFFSVKLEITNDIIFDEEQYECLHNFINKPNKIKFVD